LKQLRGITAGGTIYATDNELFPKLLGMLIFPMCQSAEMYAGVLVQEF
jgi:hypothetical protein